MLWASYKFVIAGNSDWFIVLFPSIIIVIGRCNCWMYQWTFIAIMQLQGNKFDPSILSNLCLCPNELLILQVNHSFHNFLKVSALNLQVYFSQDSSN